MELEVVGNKPATEVGSYFVANYPPFSAWTPAHVPEVHRVLDAKPGEQIPLGLYMHIPFCRKRCRFCYFRVYTDKNSSDVDDYMQALVHEIGLYSRREAFRGRQFEFVYFGGGTPSFLSSEQLQRLIDGIRRYWSWEHAREVTFECEPGTLKKQKLETIKAIGVTRLSLGIEHFDDEILELNGRAHHSPEIYRAYDWAREVGFAQINVDLIAGMVGETEDKWKLAVEKTLALQPDSLTIYQMELPHNTVISREAKTSGEAAPVADWATKRRWVDYAFGQFEAAGYKVSSAYTLVKPSPSSSFVYRDSLWHGADMVGTGVASFSHVGGVHYQNVDQWDDYLAALGRDELPVARALPVSSDQRLIRELILQLKLGRLDLGYFRDKFRIEPAEKFGEAFGSLRQEGYAEANGASKQEFRLTREGLLRVDSLLPRFFEPHFRNVRYT